MAFRGFIRAMPGLQIFSGEEAAEAGEG